MWESALFRCTGCRQVSIMAGCGGKWCVIMAALSVEQLTPDYELCTKKSGYLSADIYWNINLLFLLVRKSQWGIIY